VKRLSVARGAALVAAAAVGAVAVISVHGGASAQPPVPPPAVSTAPVVRGDLSSAVLTAGSLGYGTVGTLVNQLSGTLTWLPNAGALIRQGKVLYRVDNAPVFLMRGATPAWRAFVLGMTDGPDVSELQSDLIALGDARGLLSAPTGQFDLSTLYAVERWQVTEKLPVTGAIPFGEVSFLSVPLRVGALRTALGQSAAPGSAPLAVTDTRRIVTVPVNPTLPPVTVGERVSIQLASGQTTPGVIAAVGTSGSGTPTAITIVPRHPAAIGTQPGGAVQVALTTQSVHAALTVPVSAMLALAGGGYGVEVVTPSGAHRLIGVHVGLFAGNRVQISGAGLAPGTRVVVAQ
jgi:peptidoglycan hydrolase-like protein with peptidoglycan-binding domain